MKIKTRKKNSSDLQPITKICFFILLHELHKPDGFKIAGFFWGIYAFHTIPSKTCLGEKVKTLCYILLARLPRTTL